MSLRYTDSVMTGDVVKLNPVVATHLENGYPNKAFWHGEFRVNVIPMPCEGEEVKQFKVEFTEHPVQEQRRGFAMILSADGTPAKSVPIEPALEGIEIIERVV